MTSTPTTSQVYRMDAEKALGLALEADNMARLTASQGAVYLAAYARNLRDLHFANAVGLEALANQLEARP